MKYYLTLNERRIVFRSTFLLILHIPDEKQFKLFRARSQWEEKLFISNG